MKKKNIATFLVFVALFFFQYLMGQSYIRPSVIQSEPLGIRQGLSQGMVNCIIQDREGYMWFCTKDGLNRYDGYSMIHYRNNPNDPYSLPDNFCNQILEDDRGNIWVGTYFKGLFLFDKRTERFFPVSLVNQKKENSGITDLSYYNDKLFIKSLKDVLILDVSKVNVRRDSAVAATNARLLFSYKHSSIRYLKNSILNQNKIIFYSFMPDNSLWISRSDSIIQIVPNKDFSSFSSKVYTHEILGIKKPKNSFIHIFPIYGDLSNILIIYDNIINHYNTKTKKITYTTTFKRTPKSTYYYYKLINDGSICLFVDSSAIIYHPKTKHIETLSTIFNGLPMGSSLNLYIDRNKIQWFGSTGFGINKIDPRKKLFKNYKSNFINVFWKIESLNFPNNLIRNLNRYKFITLEIDTQGNYFASIENKNLNNIYFHINTRTGTYKEFSFNIDHSHVQGKIYTDPDNEWWLYYQNASGKNCISRINKETGVSSAIYNIPNDLESPETYVSQIYWDSAGIMWLTTINGLYAFNKHTLSWKHWKNKPGNNKSLSADKLLCITPDPHSQKYLWIGTEGAGFNRFDKSTGDCIQFNEQSGLPNNVAYCMLNDSLGNIWISTNNGLSCFNPINNSFKNFTNEDGLPGNEFNRNDAFYLQNNELMFGGVDGFVIFNPSEVLKGQPAAPLVFTGITIFNKSIDWKANHFNLQAPVNYAKKLTLKPNQNVFSISFATLEYRSNIRKMYTYKLEGFDQNWTSPSSKREVTYTNLSPGTYTFYVKGANTDGIWNKNPISMKIIVLPYWYQTLWFKLISLILIGMGIYLFFRYRLNQVLKIEKLRNRIARDLHDEIGSTLSSISIYAESAKKISAGNKKVENILAKINIGTSDMMEAMSDIVWAVKTGSGHFDDLANRLRSYAVHVTEAKNIQLQFTDNKDIPDISLNMEQRKNIYLICKEAISNAIKYSNCSIIGVLIRKDSGKLVILIRDNGRGFEHNDSNNMGLSLGGNGLKNMKSRAMEIDAEIAISSIIDGGTTISLYIPL